MSHVTVSVVENTTSVVVSNDVVEINVTESPVTVSTGTSGPQGASYDFGDPIYVTVRNATGATLTKGTIVYTSGAQGNHTLVQKANASSDATSARTLGWVSADIPNNSDGFVVVEGYLDGIDTDHIAEGSQLYLSTVAGSFTATKPVAPIHLVYVGVVTKSNPGNGRVLVKVQNGYELDELHDVKITTPVNNQVLTYDSATDLWINATNPADGVTSITAASPLTGGTITSTGSIGLDQSLLTLAQSQVTNLVADLAGKANLAGGNNFTEAQTITGTVASSQVLTVKGANGQSANMLEVQNSSAGIVGRLTVFGGAIFSGVGVYGSQSNSPNSQLFVNATTATTPGLVVRGASGQTADLQQWQNNSGTVLTYINSAGALRTTSSIKTTALDGVAATLAIQPASASTIGGVIRGAASQTANLQEWQNSAGAVLASITSAGALSVSSGNATISAGGAIRGVEVSTASDLATIRQANSGGFLRMTRQTAALNNQGANIGALYFRDGTNAGTLRLVVRAGAAGAETTILDNIPQ